MRFLLEYPNKLHLLERNPEVAWKLHEVGLWRVLSCSWILFHLAWDTPAKWRQVKSLAALFFSIFVRQPVLTWPFAYGGSEKFPFLEDEEEKKWTVDGNTVGMFLQRKVVLQETALNASDTLARWFGWDAIRESGEHGTNSNVSCQFSCLFFILSQLPFCLNRFCVSTVETKSAALLFRFFLVCLCNSTTSCPSFCLNWISVTVVCLNYLIFKFFFCLIIFLCIFQSS